MSDTPNTTHRDDNPVLTVIDGKLMNTRDVGNAVAKLMLEGMPLDEICQIPGMPTPTQIAYMRRTDQQFADAMQTAFEGGGIEAALVLLKGARDGKVGKNQVNAAMWVAERMAPDLFMERKETIQTERQLSDEELAYQLQAAARSDERIKRLLENHGQVIGELTHTQDEQEAHRQAKEGQKDREKINRRDLKKLVARRRVISKPNAVKDITPSGAIISESERERVKDQRNTTAKEKS